MVASAQEGYQNIQQSMGGDILSGYTDYERGSLAMGAAALKAEQSNNVLGQQKSTTSYTHETNVFIGKCIIYKRQPPFDIQV